MINLPVSSVRRTPARPAGILSLSSATCCVMGGHYIAFLVYSFTRKLSGRGVSDRGTRNACSPSARSRAPVERRTGASPSSSLRLHAVHALPSVPPRAPREAGCRTPTPLSLYTPISAHLRDTTLATTTDELTRTSDTNHDTDDFPAWYVMFLSLWGVVLGAGCSVGYALRNGWRVSICWSSGWVWQRVWTRKW